MQLLSATLEFAYEAEVFEGDPTDAYELGRLEAQALESDLLAAIESVVGNTLSFKIEIKPGN